MEFNQLIYTACKTGINNTGNGFQIFSYSQGMSSEYCSIEGIGKMCKYRTPNNLPSTPSDSEIETLCPISYSYNKIDEQHYYVAQNRYVGLDNTGKRYGNFISHCVEISGHVERAILTIGSKAFIKNLPVNLQNLDNVPAYLECINDEQLFSGYLSFEEVAQFVNEDTILVYYLRMMINALVDGMKTKKRLIICDEPERVPYWIAAVRYAFAQEIAREITFTTYAYDPLEADCTISGVLPTGTVYTPSYARDIGVFHIFDFINDYFSFDDNTGKYADMVESGYTFSRSILDNVHVFMTSMADTIVDKESLSNLCDAYQLYNGNIGGVDIARVREVLTFMHTQKTPYIKDYFSKVLSVLEETDSEEINVIYMIIKYAYIYATNIRNDELLKKIYYVYWMQVLNITNEYQVYGKDNIENFELNIFTIDSSIKRQLMDALFTDDISKEIVISIHEDTVEYHNVFWGCKILSFLRDNNVKLEEFSLRYNSDILKEIYINIQLLVNPIGCILKMVCEVDGRLRYDFLRSIIQIANDGRVKKELQEKVVEFLKQDQDIYLMNEFLDELTDSEEYQLKTEISKYLLQNSRENTETFYKLVKKLSEDERYWNNYKENIVRYYMNLVARSSLDIQKLYDFAIYVLQNIDSSEICDEIIDLFGNRISIANIKSGDLEKVTSLLQESPKRGLYYEKSKIYSIWLLCRKIFERNLKNENDFLTLCSCRWELFNDNEFKYILNKILKQQFAMLNTLEAQENFIVCFEKDRERFWEFYCKELFEIAERSPRVFVSAWEYAEKNAEVDTSAILNYMSDIQKKRAEHIFEKAEQYVDKKLKKTFKRFEENVIDEIERNNPGIFGKMFKVFERKEK